MSVRCQAHQHGSMSSMQSPHICFEKEDFRLLMGATIIGGAEVEREFAAGSAQEHPQGVGSIGSQVDESVSAGVVGWHRDACNDIGSRACRAPRGAQVRCLSLRAEDSEQQSC